MCTVSMIGQHYGDMWQQQPWFPQPGKTVNIGGVSRAEFETLKRQVEELKSLLIRAKKYDEDNGEPDCETEAKMAMLRKIAEAVGIDLDEVIGK